MSDRAEQGPPRISGVVRSFMPEKGFGFIGGDDGRDYFVPAKNVEGGELIDRQSVEFEGQPSPIRILSGKRTGGDMLNQTLEHRLLVGARVRLVSRAGSPLVFSRVKTRAVKSGGPHERRVRRIAENQARRSGLRGK